MRARLPESKEVWQVYAVIVVLLAGWTITAFLWKLSAWLLFLNLGEIFTIFSYAMAANLVESLLILLVLVVASVLLPSHVLREDFAVRGVILATGFIGALMAFVRLQMQFGVEGGASLFIGPILVIALTALLVGLSTRPRLMYSIRSVISWISDRLVIFLFILLPLFLISSVYILLRNVT